MASGISNAKGRRSSKTKNNGKSRAKIGLPAKAGKRRPHNIVKGKDGNYVAGPFVARPKIEQDERRMFIMDYSLPVNPPGYVNFLKMKG